MGFPSNIFNSHSKKDGDFFLGMTKILGFKPKKLDYYKRAFLHRSANIKDKDGTPMNYERLEFLGDSMLGTIISKHLYDQVPEGDEGYLTKMRSKIVSRKHLNELGKDLELIKFVQSRIPKTHFGENIHGNVFEALVGAIYLDRGYKYCEKFISQQVIDPYVDIEQLEGKVISYKSLIIEWCQKQKKTFDYNVYEDTGNDTLKHFAVKLTIGGKVMAKARATSKKKAEERASKRAYYALQDRMEKS
ncbi:ribonuclease III [Euzebyella marina]|uniref:Ribonuclease 3 n=1 Tax=Euzebyella marina TaxID=1761453 RepID=A0A3G2L149_9FLAO|nr:ribonuclease III [Euzebyella marina]AYN65982.1 ribonuclease III [Euzebyella marina]MAU71229.1 ribonuclease III [Pseudozobellia sp.]MBG49300.1 ribonuclease III [Pseudozobellia sp.]|tara:strand:+ start:1328403 stop:1329140 length:738 start_codon:yes stop_codon:yes gene_type:complete